MTRDTNDITVTAHHYNLYSDIRFTYPHWDKTRLIKAENKAEAERKVDLLYALDERYDNFVVVTEDYPDLISTTVAVDGKAPIAAYVYLFHKKSQEEIAEMLSVSTDTVEQYLSDVISGRR